MNRLPRLVSEKIGWYQWKAQIDVVNSEYLTNITYYDGWEGSLLWVKFHTFQFRKTYDSGITFNFYIKRVCHVVPRREHIVAILPSKYYFTSGSHNPNGFLSIKSSKHNWMPDFYSQW